MGQKAIARAILFLEAELGGDHSSPEIAPREMEGKISRPAIAPLLEFGSRIRSAFSAASVEEVLERLDSEGSDWSKETAKTIRAKSPTATKLAFRQIREGAKLSFDDCMRMEFRMVNRVIAGHEFYEGVRATIIDKDGAPKWNPAELAQVSDADIDAYFAPLDNKELIL